MNPLLRLAKRSKRDYITPEDVSECLKKVGTQKTRIALLEVLGRKLTGCEDYSLCCFVAHKGLRKGD